MMLPALVLALAGAAAAPPASFTVPVEYVKLDNGLKVVLSRDTTAPTAVVLSTNNRPEARAEGPHRIRAPVEHMMFQGSANLARWSSST